jgi:alpha-1,3-rhamnosyl/mannosyltransferase
VLDRHGLSRGRYFFCLSNPKPHKNLSTLIEGFCGQSSGWELALNLGPDDLAPAPRLRLLGAPSDAEARALMAGAGAVVFPSLYEGFGLPPVEAACLGAPIVVSRIPAHREALADLAPDEVLWVDPADPAAWSRALERAARGEVPGASAASRARLLRRFSSEAMGAGMDRIYRRVLGIPGQ